jgi:subtilisin family serine protease
MSVGLFNATVQGLDVVRRIKRPRETLATFAVGQGEASDIVVTNLEPERAEMIAATAPQLTIGENTALGYGGGPINPLRDVPTLGSSLLALTTVKPQQIRFQVLGAGDKPLEGAVVSLIGDTVPSQAPTDAKGEVILDLYTIQDRPARALHVTKPGGYWDMYLTEPDLADSTTNVVRLRSYTETISGFPEGFSFGWGQRLMGLDRMTGFTGAGVKIAIIDSGVDNGHPLLSHIRIGRDLSEGADPAAWNNDLVGHGSHCAGIIAARSDNEITQMRGFAPDAEVHVLKVFPGGRYDSLIDALNYCIDQRIDVVNMSLGGDDTVNPVVEEMMAAAVHSGVACVVAAGNSGDTVKYPARSPNALAVAAVGDVDEAQPNSWDRSTVRAPYVAADGIFSPTFTCHGPEVAVCAPGVAIISTVPGGSFEAQSGTSMAAPHVTGLAALFLAHHPIFRDVLRERNQARVAGLFSMIRSICVPYPFGVDRTGAGVPRLDGVAESVFQQARPAAEAGAVPQAAQPAPTNGGQQQFAAQAAGPPLGAQLGGVIGGFLPFQVAPPVPTVDPRYVADPRVLWLLSQQRGW